MKGYAHLAGDYDRLTWDVDYRIWLRWYRRWFDRQTSPVETVADLGCGTGTLTCLLAQEGYAVTGIDLSPEMLTQAMDKALDLPEEQRPLLVCQSMEALALPEPVDAVVCSLDGINHLTQRSALTRTLKRVRQALKPGGLFLFDLLPLWELERRDGQVYLDETEDTLCLWRAEWNPRRQSIHYGLDLFHTEDGVHWTRSQEEQLERSWTLEQLHERLTGTGFQVLSLTGEDGRSAPQVSDSRVFYVCSAAGADDSRRR